MISTSDYKRLQAWLWNTDPGSRRGRYAMNAMRYVAALARDLAQGEISLRATSLVYTSLLSMVPLLALAFSLLKAVGVHERLEPALRQLLYPLGDEAKTVAHSLFGFIENMRAGVLGVLGVVMLIYTAVTMITKIEGSFNFIWNIRGAPGLSKRLGAYLVVLVIGPMMVFAAIGLTASVRNQLAMQLMAVEPFGRAILLLSRMLPYLLMIGVLIFIYAYIPNTRVQFRAAAIGGLFGGTVWQSASAAFATFVANANYKAVYSSFAVVILLLLWIYTAWLIILVGCRLAFYVQHPRFLPGIAQPPPPSCRAAEAMALRLMALIGRRTLAGEAPLRFEELRDRLAVPAEQLESTVAGLLRQQVLAELQPGRRLLPQRDMQSYSVAQLWLWSRGDTPQVAAGEEQDRLVLATIGDLESRGAGQAAPTMREWLREESFSARPTPPSVRPE